MPRLVRDVLLAGAMTLTAAALAQAQTATAAYGAERGGLEVAVTGGAMLSNAIPSQSFWSGGGSVEVAGEFYRGLSAVADIGGTHAGNINSTGVGLDMVTATFGPRYTWRPRSRKIDLFGQALAGEAFGFHGLFPASEGAMDSDSNWALQLGGGVDMNLRPRVAVRVIEADWLRTNLPNSAANAQNNLRLGAGIVFRFR